MFSNFHHFQLSKIKSRTTFAVKEKQFCRFFIKLNFSPTPRDKFRKFEKKGNHNFFIHPVFNNFLTWCGKFQIWIGYVQFN